MSNRRGGLREVLRSLVPLAAAGVVVGAAVLVLSQLMTPTLKNDPATRPVGKGEEATVTPRAEVSRADVGRRDRVTASRRTAEVEIVEAEDEADEQSAKVTTTPVPAAAPSAVGLLSAEQAEYLTRKASTPARADAQEKLARWCDAHGLRDAATPHWEAVTRANPGNEKAWKRLGYKRWGGRWQTEAMIADETAQARADLIWKKTLDALHRRMHGKGPDASQRRTEAEAELTRVDDPRAIPMLWKVFAGDAAHHLLLVGELSRIRSPRGSRMLAALTVYSRDAKVRFASLNGLKGRDPAEFAEPVIAVLGPEMKVNRVRIPVPGGGTTPALEVEDERVTRQLIYVVAQARPPGTDSAFGGCSDSLNDPSLNWTAEGRTFARELNKFEARKAEDAAELQIKSDLATVAALNASIRELNDRALKLLTETTGTNFGEDRDAWRRWLAARQGRTYIPLDEGPKETIAQLVTPIYRPTFIDIPAPS